MERKISKVKNVALDATRHVTVTAMCAATLVAGKLALSFVPNIEVVTTLVVVYAFVFGFDALGSAFVFCLLDIIIYPPSLDVIISYFIYWNALAAVIIIIRALGARSEYLYLLAAVIMTALFGVLTSFVSHLVAGLPFIATYLAGIPFYIAHIVSTVVFMFAGFKPLTKVLAKIKQGLYKNS